MLEALRGRAKSPHVRVAALITGLLFIAFMTGLVVDAFLPSRDPSLALCRPPLPFTAVESSEEFFPVRLSLHGEESESTLGMSPQDYIFALNASLSAFEPALRVGDVKVSLSESTPGLTMPINAEATVLGVLNVENGLLREISVVVERQCLAQEDSLARRILIAASHAANTDVLQDFHAAQVIELGAKAEPASEPVRQQVGGRVYVASIDGEKLVFTILPP